MAVIGNLNSFKEFFDKHYALLVMFIEKYIASSDDAVDIAQDTFVRLWNSDIAFANEDKAKSFLYATAKNMSLNFLRHNNVKSRHLVLSNYEEQIEYVSNEMEQETFKLIYDAIESLPPQSKKIVYLMMEGNGNSEIADILNISVNTVKTLKYNAMAKLKDFLKDKFYIFLLLIN